MEVNGIANIKLIIEMAKQDGKIDESVAKSLLDQSEVLHQYMNEVFKTAKQNESLILGCGAEPSKVKAWHEVRIEVLGD